MKYILLICAFIVGSAQCLATGENSETTVPELHERTTFSFADLASVNPQSVEELNAAARDQIIRELGLKGDKRKQFEAIYKSYREALDRAIATASDAATQDEASQRRNLKTKLSNIAATARVKDEYVDKFAAVLTTEQIRQLYNAEGAIGTNIKRMAVSRSGNNLKIKGSGQMVTQDRGAAGSYTKIIAGYNLNVTVSPTANTIKITADDNAIDYIQVKNEDGVLSFKIDARSTEDVSVSVVVPASSALSQIEASGYSKVVSTMPLKGQSVKIVTSGGATVTADMDGTAANLNVSGYAKYSGSIRATDCTLNVSGGASAQIAVNCTNNCSLDVSGYGKLSGSIDAGTFKGSVSGGASLNSPVTANDFSLTTGGYGKFRGTMKTKQAVLKSTGGSSISGTFTCDSFIADATGYGKITLSGSSSAVKGQVSVTSGASFSAPELKVGTYSVIASSYGKASIYCTQTLKVNATSGGTVVYDGKAYCDVTSNNGNVRHK